MSNATTMDYMALPESTSKTLVPKDHYILDGFETEELSAAIRKSVLYPLIREMEFKFKLKVIKSWSTVMTRMDGVSEVESEFLLAYPSGFCVGKISVDTSNIKKGNSTAMQYCFRSPYRIKARGKTLADKESTKSEKVSVLVKTLVSKKMVISEHELIQRKIKRNVIEAQDTLTNCFKKPYVHNDLNDNDLRLLLASWLGEEADSEWLSINQTKCKELFDKYKKQDRMVTKQRVEMNQFFNTPFYMVGVDGNGYFTVGKLAGVAVDASNPVPVPVPADATQATLFTVMGEKVGYWANHYMTIVEPFKRYKHIEDYPELVPLITMIKAKLENTGTEKFRILPNINKFDQDLNAIFTSTNNLGNYAACWMFTPCGPTT